MSTIVIRTGDLVSQDPADIKVYQFDWGTENLAAGVSIVSSTWTITPVRPSVGDVALVKDSEAVLAGDRSTQVRLSVGMLGKTYEIANKVTTNESPSQTKERSFRLLIENK